MAREHQPIDAIFISWTPWIAGMRLGLEIEQEARLIVAAIHRSKDLRLQFPTDVAMSAPQRQLPAKGFLQFFNCGLNSGQIDNRGG